MRALPIAVVRRTAPPGRMAGVVPEACGVVWAVLKAAGVRGAGRHVAVYRPGAEGVVKMEIGVEVERAVGCQGDVFDSFTPAGEVATVAHLGPYGRLGDAHLAIRHWCSTHHREPAGITWEIYGHWLPDWNDDPSQIRTDVFHLLGA